MAQVFSGPPISFNKFFDRARQLGKAPSIIRISLGLASNFADVYAFRQFLRGYSDRTVQELPWRPVPDTNSLLLRDSA